jgi:hypothetical protein
MISGDDAALIVTDGGLSGLLACFVEGVCRPLGAVGPESGTGPKSKRPVVWFAVTSDQASQREARLAAARHAASLARISTLIEWSPGPDERPSGSPGSVGRKSLGPERSRLLMAAGAEAIRHGLARIVWPVQLGGAGIDDASGQEPGAAWLDAIADTSDRALVCSRLLSLDLPGATDMADGGLTIQTPFVDFTDAQIADLAADVDLPVEAAFLGSAEAERSRWRVALAKAGIPMPAADGSGLSPTVRASVVAGTRR